MIGLNIYRTVVVAKGGGDKVATTYTFSKVEPSEAYFLRIGKAKEIDGENLEIELSRPVYAEEIAAGLRFSVEKDDNVPLTQLADGFWKTACYLERRIDLMNRLGREFDPTVEMAALVKRRYFDVMARRRRNEEISVIRFFLSKFPGINPNENCSIHGDTLKDFLRMTSATPRHAEFDLMVSKKIANYLK